MKQSSSRFLAKTPPTIDPARRIHRRLDVVGGGDFVTTTSLLTLATLGSKPLVEAANGPSEECAGPNRCSESYTRER